MRNMSGICESIECLCNSPQRLKILSTLEETQMDVRELMEVLDSPRSTIQRNLRILEERSWIERAGSGYTTTTVGDLLCTSLVEMSDTITKIECMEKFLNTLDTPMEVNIDRLDNVIVTTPEQNRPHFPRKRLTTLFGEAECVRGFLPVVSSLSVEESRHVDASSEPKGEYVVSSAAFDALHQQYTDGGINEGKIDPPAHIDIWVYDGGACHRIRLMT